MYVFVWVRYCCVCVVILNIEPILKQKQNDDKGVTYLSVSAVSFFGGCFLCECVCVIVVCVCFVTCVSMF